MFGSKAGFCKIVCLFAQVNDHNKNGKRNEAKEKCNNEFLYNIPINNFHTRQKVKWSAKSKWKKGRLIFVHRAAKLFVNFLKTVNQLLIQIFILPKIFYSNSFKAFWILLITFRYWSFDSCAISLMIPLFNNFKASSSAVFILLVSTWSF